MTISYQFGGLDANGDDVAGVENAVGTGSA